MIKFEYKPNVIDTPFGALDDPPPVESVTMTLGGDVSWNEAVCEFQNFLRAAGYVIPYDFEKEDEDESNTDVAPEMKPWAWLNDKEIDEIKQTAPAYVSAKAVNTVVDMVEEKLNQKYEWGDDDGNTEVASEDESNTDVAEDDDWRSWTPITLEEIQDLEREYQTVYAETTYFDRMGFANAIEKRLKELNT